MNIPLQQSELMFFKGILKIAWQPYRPLLVSSLPHSPKIRTAFHLLEILLKPWISSSPPHLTLNRKHSVLHQGDHQNKKRPPSTFTTNCSSLLPPAFLSEDDPLPPALSGPQTSLAFSGTLYYYPYSLIHVPSQHKERFTHCKVNEYQKQMSIFLNTTSLLLGIYIKD